MPSATESAPTATPSPAATATLTPIPQPVFDPAQLGNLDKLAGYVVSGRRHMQKGTSAGGKGAVRDIQSELTVITHPWQAQLVLHLELSGVEGQAPAKRTDTYYWTGHTIYHGNKEADYWFISPDNNESVRWFFDWLLNPAAVVASLGDVQFAGQEDVHGLPANHFTFDKTGALQGNLLLAVEGNYPLHLDYTETGDVWPEGAVGSHLLWHPGTSESSLDVTTMTQVKAIDLPPEAVMQVPLDLGVPLPPGTVLSDVGVLGSSPQHAYHYTMPLSGEDAMAFFRALQPTNGWALLETAVMGQDGIVRITKGGETLNLTVRWTEGQPTSSLSFYYTPPP